MLLGVRWYVAYPLSTRHVEALMEERGVDVDHSTINRWTIKESPRLDEAFPRRQRPVWGSWRLAETSIKVKGQWRYLYRAVDNTGQTIDVLLTEARDEQAAKRFLTQASRRHGVPEKSTIAGSAAKEAAIKSDNAEHGTAIALRKGKYLHHMVEQDHRGVKRSTRPLLGAKRLTRRRPRSSASNSCTCSSNGNWWSKRETRASLRPNCSPPWPPHPFHRQGQLPLHDLLSKICDKTAISAQPPKM